MEVEEAIVSSITITAGIMIPSSAKVAATITTTTTLPVIRVVLALLVLVVAVLAVDPTSSRSGGSILGDKTRMARLSQGASTA